MSLKQHKASAIRQLEAALELTPTGDEFRVDFGPTILRIANTPEAIHCMIARLNAFPGTGAKVVRKKQGFAKFKRIHPNFIRPEQPTVRKNKKDSHLLN